MKNILGVVAILALVISGCKKAENEPVYYCKNTCYLCYAGNNLSDTSSFCNTDFSEALFQQILADYSLVGYICNEVAPTIFNEVSGSNSQAHIDSQQANRLNCYDKRTFFPQYFDYPSFYAAYVERSTRCGKCYDSIAERYIEIYMDTLESYYGRLSECPECATSSFCSDTAMPYAVAKVNAMGMHCGIQIGTLFSMPKYMASYLRQRQFEPISPTFTQEERDDMIALNSWLDFNPRAQDGINNAAIFRECP